MLLTKRVFFLVLYFFLAGCREVKNHSAEDARNVVERQNQPGPLLNARFIDSIASRLLEKKEDTEIWNLYSADTSGMLVVDDHFLNASRLSRVVLMNGAAGLSAGSANHLLLVFEDTLFSQPVWAGQVGSFKKSDIRDLNHDGIKEIQLSSGGVWMGECFSNFSIINFKGGNRHVLYSASSESVIDCGLDSINSRYTKGDTIEREVSARLQDPDRDQVFEVQQTSRISIHGGGASDREVLKNRKLVAVVDTVPLRQD